MQIHKLWWRRRFVSYIGYYIDHLDSLADNSEFISSRRNSHRLLLNTCCSMFVDLWPFCKSFWRSASYVIQLTKLMHCYLQLARWERGRRMGAQTAKMHSWEPARAAQWLYGIQYSLRGIIIHSYTEINLNTWRKRRTSIRWWITNIKSCGVRQYANESANCLYVRYNC